MLYSIDFYQRRPDPSTLWMCSTLRPRRNSSTHMSHTNAVVSFVLFVSCFRLLFNCGCGGSDSESCIRNSCSNINAINTNKSLVQIMATKKKTFTQETHFSLVNNKKQTPSPHTHLILNRTNTNNKIDKTLIGLVAGWRDKHK